MNQLTAGDRLKRTLDLIRELEVRYSRPERSVSLLAVSKRKPISAIEAAASVGQADFGENYPDEGIAKVQALPHLKLRWHFIGAVQSRKTGVIAEHFDWVHSVDRLKVARRLSAQRNPAATPLNVCLQVNIDGEASKSGVSLDELEPLMLQCADLPNLRLRGLMAIPAIRAELSEQRAPFAKLRTALDTLKKRQPTLDTLSMGMSGDLEAAIAEGATIVRVGTAIFGERDG